MSRQVIRQVNRQVSRSGCCKRLVEERREAPIVIKIMNVDCEYLFMELRIRLAPSVTTEKSYTCKIEV